MVNMYMQTLLEQSDMHDVMRRGEEDRGWEVKLNIKFGKLICRFPLNQWTTNTAQEKDSMSDITCGQSKWSSSRIYLFCKMKTPRTARIKLLV